MVLATLVLVFAMPQVDDTAKVKNDLAAVSADSSATSANSTKDTTLIAAALPSAPAAKVAADPIAPVPAAQPFLPAKPVFTRPRETPRQR